MNRVESKMFRGWSAFWLGLFLAAPPLFAADLDLFCKPLYAVPDSREIRPPYVRAMSPFFTYYLFDSRDLLHFRFELINNSPQPIEIGELGWPERLQLTVRRDGELLPPGAVHLRLLQRNLHEVSWFLEGRRLEGVEFRRRDNGWGSEPVQEFDAWQEERRGVDELPPRLATHERAGVDVAIVDGEGEPLAPGVYVLGITDPQTGKSCPDAYQIVLSRPETELDRVDGHLARSYYYVAQGDQAGADAEAERSYAENPGNLTALVQLIATLGQRGELERQLELVDKLRETLSQPGAKAGVADSTTMQDDARILASDVHRGEVLGKLAAKNAKP